MTNSKLIDCTNAPWDSNSGLPDHIYVWVPKDWSHAEMYRKHADLCYKKKETDLGFAEWLLTQGATLAVSEKWGIPE